MKIAINHWLADRYDRLPVCQPIVIVPHTISEKRKKNAVDTMLYSTVAIRWRRFVRVHTPSVSSVVICGLFLAYTFLGKFLTFQMSYVQNKHIAQSA